MYVVAEEVDGLAGRVNLSLIDIFALPEHGGCVHDGAILGGKQLGALHDDGGTDGPVGICPLFVSLHGCIDGHANLLLTSLVITGEDVTVVVRADHLGHVARADFLASDDEGDVDHGVHLTLQLGFEGDALG